MRRKTTEEEKQDGTAFSFDSEYNVAQLFIDNAKTYVQLSGAALVLCSAFVHEVAGVPKDQKVPPPDVWMIMPWLGFLFTIGFGAFYQ